MLFSANALTNAYIRNWILVGADTPMDLSKVAIALSVIAILVSSGAIVTVVSVNSSLNGVNSNLSSMNGKLGSIGDQLNVTNSNMNQVASAAGVPLNSNALELQDYMAQLYQQAKPEGVVNWYSVNDIIFDQALANAFEAAYPGITVNIFQGSTPAVLQRVTSEHQAHKDSVDVIGHAGDISLYEQQGLIKDYVPMAFTLGNYTQANAGYNVDNDSFVWVLDGAAIAYNPALVNSSQVDTIKSWSDLANPMWKGMIGLADPLAFTIEDEWFLAMNQTTGQSYSGQITQLISGIWANKPHLDVSWSPTARSVADGTDGIATSWAHVANGLELTGENVSVHWVNPIYVLPEVTSLATYAPHPYAAMLFENFLFSQAGMTILANKGDITTRPGIPLTTTIPSNDTIIFFGQQTPAQVSAFQTAITPIVGGG